MTIETNTPSTTHSAPDWTRLRNLPPHEQARLAREIEAFVAEFRRVHPTQSTFHPESRYIPFRRAKLILTTWCPGVSVRALYRYALSMYPFTHLPSSIKRLYAKPITDFPGWFEWYEIPSKRFFFFACEKLNPYIVKWAEAHRLTIPAPALPLARQHLEQFKQIPPCSFKPVLRELYPNLSKYQLHRIHQHLTALLEAQRRYEQEQEEE